MNSRGASRKFMGNEQHGNLVSLHYWSGYMLKSLSVWSVQLGTHVTVSAVCISCGQWTPSSYWYQYSNTHMHATLDSRSLDQHPSSSVLLQEPQKRLVQQCTLNYLNHCLFWLFSKLQKNTSFSCFSAVLTSNDFFSASNEASFMASVLAVFHIYSVIMEFEFRWCSPSCSVQESHAIHPIPRYLLGALLMQLRVNGREFYVMEWTMPFLLTCHLLEFLVHLDLK